MEGQYRIDSMWAFTTIDADGSEGVCAFLAADGTMMPMVGADLARVAALKPIAQQIADANGSTVTLAHFSTRTVQEVITPSADSRQAPS